MSVCFIEWAGRPLPPPLLVPSYHLHSGRGWVVPRCAGTGVPGQSVTSFAVGDVVLSCHLTVRGKGEPMYFWMIGPSVPRDKKGRASIRIARMAYLAKCL